MKTRVLISGCDGQLMTDIRKVLYKYEEYSVLAANRGMMDVTNPYQCKNIFGQFKPHVYIHGASIHVVDKIESNPSKAFDVNVVSVYTLGKLCNEYNSLFVNFSTDYVFDGQGISLTGGLKALRNYQNQKHYGIASIYPDTEYSPSRQYLDGYTEDAHQRPLNLYGLSKYSSEMATKLSAERYLNVRVCGLFGKKGSQQKGGINFPFIVLKHIEENKEMKVVNDQWITVGYTMDIAESLIRYIETKKLVLAKTQDVDLSGHETLHIMNEGILTWYDMALYIATLFRKEHLIKEVSSSEIYSKTSDRPHFSALKNTKLPELPSWESAVTRFLIEIGKLKVESPNDS